MNKKLIIFSVIFCAGLSLIRNPVRQFFQPLAVIVPHHDIVADIRSEYLARISQARPQTKSIILLSPDHFSSDQRSISYSDKDWQLQDTVFEFDDELGRKISSDARLNSSVVASDHGIFNQLSDLKSSFPHSRIVPFLIGNNVPQTRLDTLVNLIARNCQSDCLLVASVDFSHYLPAHLGDIHDLYSHKILQRLDIDSYSNLEVDSPQSLYIVMKMAQIRQTRTFSMFAHTNSGHIQGSPDVESTSHLFGSYSRIYSSSVNTDFHTFAVATNLNRELSQTGVGDRFFYGMDYLDPHLSVSYSPSPGVVILPADKSNLSREGGRLIINLGPDLVVAGVVSPKLTSLLFLPLNASNSSFLRYDLKTSVLQQLLSPITPDHSTGINIQSGIIELH